jgi:hypothetical protein
VEDLAMPPEENTGEPWKLFDRVKIRYSEWTGRIVELRGPLGPGGAQVYRVRVRFKPKPFEVEVLGNQLILLPPKEKEEKKG